MVASCGTALTPQQAQLLRRFTSKVVLSFDPDAAGQGAAVRSCELLVGEGFDVNVALLPAGADPDTFVQRQGRDAYQDRLRASVPYLQFLLDRAATVHDLRTRKTAAGRFFTRCSWWRRASRTPRPGTSSRTGWRTKRALRKRWFATEIRKAAGARKTSVPERLVAPAGPLKPAERGLLWGLVHDPAAVRPMLEELEDQDLEQLAVAEVVETARELHDVADLAFPSALLERLND